MSSCPLCKTLLVKKQECNIVVCYFCNFSFCWACGWSVIENEKHFRDENAFLSSDQGCGVRQEDAYVRPGDHLKQSLCWDLKTRLNLKFLLCVLFLPLVVVFYLPF